MDDYDVPAMMNERKQKQKPNLYHENMYKVEVTFLTISHSKVCTEIDPDNKSFINKVLPDRERLPNAYNLLCGSVRLESFSCCVHGSKNASQPTHFPQFCIKMDQKQENRHFCTKIRRKKRPIFA